MHGDQVSPFNFDSCDTTQSVAVKLTLHNLNSRIVVQSWNKVIETLQKPGQSPYTVFLGALLNFGLGGKDTEEFRAFGPGWTGIICHRQSTNAGKDSLQA